jgi:hypothetical protein
LYCTQSHSLKTRQSVYNFSFRFPLICAKRIWTTSQIINVFVFFFLVPSTVFICHFTKLHLVLRRLLFGEDMPTLVENPASDSSESDSACPKASWDALRQRLLDSYAEISSDISKTDSAIKVRVNWIVFCAVARSIYSFFPH